MLRRQYQNPRFVPTQYLKHKWVNWNPNKYSRKNGGLLGQNTSYESVRNVRPSDTLPSNFDAAAANAVTEANNGFGGNGVDRNTSVRSVMTLPAYNPKPLAHEQVLGREGERDGMDTVVEYPETAEYQEARREEEMESLFQVRQARRREAEEREERRRLRREARERNDWVALEEIRRQAREESSAATSQSVEMLRAEHERIRDRERQVSSVAYGDLGVARHDGTRLRANSEESERTGLLGDAASIAVSSRYHQRQQSSTSVLSEDSAFDDLNTPSPAFTRPRSESRPESPLRIVSTGTGSTHNEQEMTETDMGLEEIPINSPPGYDPVDYNDEPPVYTSPVATRAPQFPSISERAPAPALAQPHPSIAEQTPVQIRQRAATILGPDAGTPIDRRVAAVLGPASPPPVDRTMGNRVVTSPAAMIGNSRRTSHGPPSTSTNARSGRGVGGVPQLPSLRLSALPSIVIDAGSPINPRRHSASPSPS